MTGLTVFVVADDPRADAVRALVESWTRSGILTPSLWATPSRVTIGAGGPPAVQAQLVRADGTQTVDLFEHIGRFRLDVVRIVVAHLLLQSGPAGDQEQVSEVGRQLARAVDATLPRHADTQESGCRLQRAVVIVPVSGAKEVSANVFEPAWEVNVVISPEDRPDLDRASIFVRYPGHFDGHAAAALAAVGGVLRGVPEGVLDHLTSDSTSREADAMVARVSIRTVIGEDVVDRIAGRAFSSETLAPDGPAAVLSWARPASEPDLVKQSAFDHLWARPEWAPASLPPSGAPKLAHQGALSALWTAVLFNLKTVGAVVSWTLSRGRAWVERSATEAIVGAEAGMLVHLGPRPAEDLVDASQRLLERERARTDEDMRMQETRVASPRPTTWTELRGLSTGLVDGGDLGSFPEPRQANKRELLSAAAVVASPGDKWSVDRDKWPAHGDDRPVSANDPLAMCDYRQAVEAGVRDAKATLDRARSALDAGIRARADKEAAAQKKAGPDTTVATGQTRAAATAVTSSQVVATDEPPTDVDHQGPSPSPEGRATQRLRGEVEAARERYDAELAYRDAYSTWYAAAANSLLWMLGNGVGQRARSMREQREELERHKDEEATPPADALKRRSKSVMRWWWWTISLWLVLSGVVVCLRFERLSWEPTYVPLTTKEMVWWLVGLAVIAVVSLAAANHRFYKAVRAYEWQVHQQIVRMHQEKDAKIHTGQERARYELLYGVLRDWVRIVGEVVHRPWSPPASTYENLSDEVVEALPAAMGVASQAEGNDAIPTTVMLLAYQTVYPQGWCSRAFERAYEEWECDQPDGPREGHRTVDLDVMNSPVSPRKRLVEFWTSGAARAGLTIEARERLLNAVRDGEIDLPTRVVGRIGRYGDDTFGPEPEFFHATATESTTFATDVFSAPARQGRLHYVDRSIAWIPASARAAVGAMSVEARECAGPTAVRVDVSRRVSIRDLVPFHGSAASVDADGASVAGVDGDDGGGVWH